MALADGTLARAGGRVIKNVAGYDLGKLFAGSFGSLGLVVEVAVRLHPAPARRATAIGESDDPRALQRAAIAVSRAPLELEALDVRWAGDHGALLARAAGVAPDERLAAATALMEETGPLRMAAPDEGEDQEREWARQRDGQRADATGIVVRVSAVRSELARVVNAARMVNGEVVSRAGLGLFWIRTGAGSNQDVIEDLRRALAPRPCVVLDAPEEVRRRIDAWGPVEGLNLMRRIKERFDPWGTCNPGVYVGAP